jgi:hypothetical protein
MGATDFSQGEGDTPELVQRSLVIIYRLRPGAPRRNHREAVPERSPISHPVEVDPENDQQQSFSAPNVPDRGLDPVPKQVQHGVWDFVSLVGSHPDVQGPGDLRGSPSGATDPEQPLGPVLERPVDTQMRRTRPLGST